MERPLNTEDVLSASFDVLEAIRVVDQFLRDFYVDRKDAAQRLSEALDHRCQTYYSGWKSKDFSAHAEQVYSELLKDSSFTIGEHFQLSGPELKRRCGPQEWPPHFINALRDKAPLCEKMHAQIERQEAFALREIEGQLRQWPCTSADGEWLKAIQQRWVTKTLESVKSAMEHCRDEVFMDALLDVAINHDPLPRLYLRIEAAVTIALADDPNGKILPETLRRECLVALGDLFTAWRHGPAINGEAMRLDFNAFTKRFAKELGRPRLKNIQFKPWAEEIDAVAEVRSLLRKLRRPEPDKASTVERLRDATWRHLRSELLEHLSILACKLLPEASGRKSTRITKALLALVCDRTHSIHLPLEEKKWPLGLRRFFVWRASLLNTLAADLERQRRNLQKRHSENNPELPVLVAEEVEILKALNEFRPAALPTADIEAGTTLGTNSVRTYLKRLHEKHCVNRPHGTKRKGYFITNLGIAALKATAIESPKGQE